MGVALVTTINLLKPLPPPLSWVSRSCKTSPTTYPFPPPPIPAVPPPPAPVIVPLVIPKKACAAPSPVGLITLAVTTAAVPVPVSDLIV